VSGIEHGTLELQPEKNTDAAERVLGITNEVLVPYKAYLIWAQKS
jgi:hypothetical protein